MNKIILKSISYLLRKELDFLTIRTSQQYITTMWICIIVASFPWDFGAYQQQALLLSHELAKQHNVQWMSFANPEPMREEIYSSAEEMYSQFHTVKQPTTKYPHLTFVGLNTTNYVTISQLNRLSANYNTDAYIFIGDVVKVIRDENMRIPSIIWFPHHYQSLTPHEEFTLGAFGGVASLSPSSALMITKYLNRPVRHIPHIVTVDATPEKKFKTWTVLMQGGNYDTNDRKGWNIGLQAFQKFNRKYPNTHLYLHAINSKEIAEIRRSIKAPLTLQTTGIPLKTLLKMYNITNYTLDEKIHGVRIKDKLKKQSHVCLHPSRVEGFGMVVLECQMLGTPVITTNFTAMADFTKYGIATSYEQLEFFNGQGFVATPSVNAVAKALEDIYLNKVWFSQSFDPKPYSAEVVSKQILHFLLSTTTYNDGIWTAMNTEMVPEMVPDIIQSFDENVIVAIIGQQHPFDTNGFIKSDIPMFVRTHHLHNTPKNIQLSVHSLQIENLRHIHNKA